MRVNGYTGLAITRLDVLTGLNELKLCTGYRLPDGSVTEDYPLDTYRLAEASAVYESMPGWEEDIRGARRWEDLPESPRAYVSRVSELLGVPTDLISVGAERNDLVALRWPI
jgi:adenylosuccinate synthase